MGGEADDLPLEPDEQIGGAEDITDEVYEQFDEQPEGRGFNEGDDQAPSTQHDDPMDDLDSPQYQIEELKLEVARLRELITGPSAFPRVFIAQYKSDGTWAETICAAGAVIPATDWRTCSSSSAASALILANASVGEYVPVIELDDPPNKRYVSLLGNALPRIAYLTQIGGSNGNTTSYCTYTYNAYFDAAKTVLAGGTLTVQAHRMLQVGVTAATRGIIQRDTTGTYTLESVLDEYPASNPCT